MKKQTVKPVFVKSLSRFFKGTAMVVLLSGMSVVSAHAAGSIPPADPIKTVNTATISSAGTRDGMLVFDVKYQNPTAEKFHVVISDSEGEIIFGDTYKETNFQKKFLVTAAVGNKVTITIRTSSGIKKEVFEVNSSTTTIESIVVKPA